MAVIPRPAAAPVVDVAALTDPELDGRLAQALRAVHELTAQLTRARAWLDALHDEWDRRAIQRKAP